MATSSLHHSQQLLIGETLRRAAFLCPDVEAFVFEGQRVTYGQMERRVLHLAGWLQSQGIGYDDKVGILLRNELAFPEIFYAVALIGAVGVPINFRLTGGEIEYIVNNSDSKMLFIGHEFAETIQSLREKLPQVEQVVVVGGQEVSGMLSYESIFAQSASYTPCETLNDDDVCLIVYTSGTTGRPKGAMLTHKNLYMNAMNLIATSGLKQRNKQLIVAPFFHIGGIGKILM